MSVHVPLMIGNDVSHNPKIPASLGNTISCVQAGGNDGLHPLTLYTHRGRGT